MSTLYLVRHGSALSKTEDPARPLSEAGRAEVRLVARAAAAAGYEVAAILHSDKLRARETAELLAEALNPTGGLRETADLAPNADPGLLRQLLDAEEGTLMLVGHLPHLPRLVSLLVTGDEHVDLVEFEAAALARLQRTPERGWCLTGLTSPRLLRLVRDPAGPESRHEVESS